MGLAWRVVRDGRRDHDGVFFHHHLALGRLHRHGVFFHHHLALGRLHRHGVVFHHGFAVRGIDLHGVFFHDGGAVGLHCLVRHHRLRLGLGGGLTGRGLGRCILGEGRRNGDDLLHRVLFHHGVRLFGGRRLVHGVRLFVRRGLVHGGRLVGRLLVHGILVHRLVVHRVVVHRVVVHRVVVHRVVGGRRRLGVVVGRRGILDRRLLRRFFRLVFRLVARREQSCCEQRRNDT